MCPGALSVSRTSPCTLTVPIPAATVDDDLLLLVEVNAANQAITTPAGWTLIADASTGSPSQFRFTVWWKAAVASEASVDLTVNTNSSGLPCGWSDITGRLATRRCL